MDFAFVPSIGNIQDLARALSLHPNTTVLTAGCDTLSDFLASVKSASAGPFNTNLAEDLILGTHADDEGTILIDLDTATPGPVTYEKLENLNTIKIPSEVNKPDTQFWMLGCLVGTKRCENFLKLLKQALGNPHTVIAPKYVYQLRSVLSKGIGATVQGVPDSQGFLENMAYEFRISSKDALGSRAEVVQAFQKANDSDPPQFVDVNGTKIPSDKWGGWVPPEANLNLKPTTADGIAFDFYAGVRIAVVNGVNLLVNTKNRALWIAARDTITVPPIDIQGLDSNKTNEELLTLVLPNVPNFKDSHPYPIYKRHHFDSLESFIKGIRWFGPFGTSRAKSSFTGQRYLYTLRIPITEPGTDNLISNYYPDGQSPIEAMFHGHVVDPRLFAVI